MTLTVEDDFREFVAACWPDLESVALLVTLEPDTARRVTTDALAGLHQHWREAVDEGVPAGLARRAVLTGAVSAQPGRPPAQGPSVAAPASGPPPPTWPVDDQQGDTSDPVVDALVVVLRGASPLERAAVAAGSVWAMEAPEVASALGVAPRRVDDAAASLHDRLLAAHESARAAQGLLPAAWALERDLADAVDVLLRDVSDPPDPAALVAERTRVVRRRSLLLAGAGALLLAGGGAWWLQREDGTTASDPAAAPPSVGPDDVTWLRTRTWMPRGPLATDAGVQALVLARSGGGSRLLWADDLGTRRIVVAAALDYDLTPASELRVWHGPRGADPSTLEDLPLAVASIEGVRDVVALTMPQDDRGSGGAASLLVVLARPTVSAASFSRLVRPTPLGTVERTWVDLPLVDGVGTRGLRGPVSAAMRVRVAGFDGPPATTNPLWPPREGLQVAPEPFTRAVHRYVEEVTGILGVRLRTEVVADSPVNGSILDPDALSATGGDGRVVALRTVTPGGAVLSSVAVTDDGRAGGGAVVVRPAAVVLAERADEPIVERVADLRDRVGRFLVVAPGAAQVQLLATSPSAYPLSKVVQTKGRAAAVVPVVNADDASALRLVARDAAGRVLFDGVPAAPRSLLDLWD